VIAVDDPHEAVVSFDAAHRTLRRSRAASTRAVPTNRSIMVRPRW